MTLAAPPLAATRMLARADAAPTSFATCQPSSPPAASPPARRTPSAATAHRRRRSFLPAAGAVAAASAVHARKMKGASVEGADRDPAAARFPRPSQSVQSPAVKVGRPSALDSEQKGLEQRGRGSPLPARIGSRGASGTPLTLAGAQLIFGPRLWPLPLPSDAVDPAFPLAPAVRGPRPL